MSSPNQSFRRLAVILFADIVGYTTLMQRDEALALQKIRHYQDILELAAQQFNGQVLKNYGDGSLMTFSNSLDAIQAAEQIQVQAREEPNVPLRIGIHVGEFIVEKDDIFGNGVNLASRIESLGVAGAVLFSKNIFQKIINHPEFEARSLGAFEFKNVEEPMEVFALVKDGFAIPSPEEIEGKTNPITSNKSGFGGKGWVIAAIAVFAIGTWYFTTQKETHIPSSSASTTSIAVLAFKDLSPNQDQEYFSDGMSEGILSLLTKIPNLKVISSTSSFHYKDNQESMATIADELAVDYILDGNVRQSDSLLRITIKLIHTKDGSQIWDHTYNHSFSDIFQIQDEIANSVARQLKLTFSDKRLNTVINDFESYRLFLEASYLHNADSPEGMIEAHGLIRNSIRNDSTYAPAWVLLSRILDRRSRRFNQLPLDEGQEFAIAASEKAIELDPDNAEAYALLATHEALQGNFGRARDLLSKAMELEPSNPLVLMYGSSVNFYLGNLSESTILQHEALAIDPLNPVHYFSLGLNYYLANEYDKALEHLKKYDYLQPKSAIHHTITSVVLTLKGEHQAALVEAEKEPSEWANLFARSNAYHGMGEQKLSDSLLHVLIDKYGNRSANSIAASYAWRNDKDQAFIWLNNAFQENRLTLMESVYYPYFSNLYDDPRWIDFLEKMNLPADHWILNIID